MAASRTGMNSRVRTAVFTSAVVLGLAGCAGPAPQQVAAPKVAEGAVRTDLAPLTSRFPALGTPVSARWRSGHFGSDRAPGPSTLWIDAVVVVDAPTAHRLTELATESSAPPPGVDPDVLAVAPTGHWRGGQQVDSTLTSTSWAVSARIDETARTVLLTSVSR